MARINVNLNDVEIPSGAAHPDGLLRVRVHKAKYVEKGKEGSSGFPYVNYQLAPVDTEIKTHVWLKLSSSPDALWNTVLFLDAIGVKHDTDGTYDTDDTLGKELKVTCTAKEYAGKPSNEIGPPYYKV